MLNWKLLLVLCLSTFMLVYGVRYYALKHLVDIPNTRSSHELPTPRGGGLACVVVFSSAALYLYLHNGLLLDELCLIGIAVGLAGIGFWDDHRPLAARWRLAAHLLAASGAICLLHGLPSISLPLGIGALDLGWAGYILGLLFLAWSLNLFNFMDGIDGIAATEATFVAAGLAWFMLDVDTNLAILALCLAVVSIGFLIWNWPPAKIFMGDVGSNFMGFTLGMIIVLFSHTKPIFGAIGLILYAVFITDASITLLRRFLSGQKCTQAHCSHAYQLLAKRYPKNGHLRVVSGIMLINLAYLLPLAIITFKQPAYAWICLICAYVPLIFLACRLKAGRQMIQ